MDYGTASPRSDVFSVEESMSEVTDATPKPAGETDDDPNAIILDPKKSERQYWSYKGVQREIWRPGMYAVRKPGVAI